jgi:hypothetical protein
MCHAMLLFMLLLLLALRLTLCRMQAATAARTYYVLWQNETPA